MNGRDFTVLLGFLLAIGIGLGFIFSLPRPLTSGTPYADLERHRQIWHQRKPASYAASFQQTAAFFFWRATATVSTDGKAELVLEQEPSDPREREMLTDPRFFPYSIDDVFTILESAYMRRDFRIDIEFDSQYGFPKDISVDRERDWVDDEWRMKVALLPQDHVG